MTTLRSITSILIACTIITGNCFAQAQSRTMTIEEARRLAYEALPSDTKKLPGLALLPDEGREKPVKCVWFDVLWDNPNGSVHVGFWAVDMRSGEVWAPILCKRVTNGTLRKLQQAVRKKLAVTKAEHQAALRHSPCCTAEHYSK
jgi:hypothetical protein